MNLFIHQAHVQLLANDERPSESFEVVLDLRHIPSSTPLPAHVWVQNADLKYIHQTLLWLMNQQLSGVYFVAFTLPNLEEVKASLKQSFKIIQAGGGLVKKEDKYLLMLRLGKWDLPKGKMDEGETFRQTAQREVEEECNVKIKTNERITTTWHYYTMRGNHYLKQTRWYAMECLDDQYIKPQLEEDIAELRWCSIEDAEKLLENSYESIRFVLRTYLHSAAANLL